MTFNAIDIFSGAGGMSLGASMAGIDIKIAVENNKEAAETFKANHPNTKIFCSDIKDINIPKEENIFVLFGGPPCQGFSVSNTKTRNSKNKNNSLFSEFIRFVEEIRPMWFVFENVQGITSFAEGNVIKSLQEKFEAINYKVKSSILVASDYGVPQDRNRFFMVGNNVGIDFIFPEKLNYKVSVGEAINDLPSLENGAKHEKIAYQKGKSSNYAKKMRKNSKSATQNYVSRSKDYVIERYKHIKQGENWKAIPKELMKNYKKLSNSHSGIYKRLDPDKPSVVIANYRKNMLIHPFEDRGLSVREAARLQSFPDDFIFKGHLSHIQQQIGNAVPPLLAKAIFEQIIKLSKAHGK